MDLTANERCIIIKTLRGYVKRLPLDEFEAQRRGTRGKAGMTNLRDDDAVEAILNCQTHDTILCISEGGVAYAVPAYKVPPRRVLGGTFYRPLGTTPTSNWDRRSGAKHIGGYRRMASQSLRPDPHGALHRTPRDSTHTPPPLP